MSKLSSDAPLAAGHLRSVGALLLTVAMLALLPLLGLVLGGERITPYLEFPPTARKVMPPPFRWPFFIGIAVVVAGVITPFTILGVARSNWVGARPFATLRGSVVGLVGCRPDVGCVVACVDALSMVRRWPAPHVLSPLDRLHRHGQRAYLPAHRHLPDHRHSPSLARSVRIERAVLVVLRVSEPVRRELVLRGYRCAFVQRVLLAGDVIVLHGVTGGARAARLPGQLPGARGRPLSRLAFSHPIILASSPRWPCLRPRSDWLASACGRISSIRCFGSRPWWS